MTTQDAETDLKSITLHYYIVTGCTQARIKVGAIDAKALGTFLKQAQMKTDENFPEAEQSFFVILTSK